MTKILNCEEEDCPKDFYELESCGETHLKTCMNCFKRVMLVATKDMANALIEEGERCALDQ
mgnify:CR=1 FL=1